MPRTVLEALAALLLLVLICAAPRAGADALDRARLAPLVSSERLRLFTLARAVDTSRAQPAVTRALRRALHETGFYHQGAPAIIARDARISPVLAWDDNINGGYFSNHLDLGSLIFDTDPANMARPGLVFGARLDASARLAWGEGRVIDLHAGVELGWSPRYDIGRAFASVEACSRNHLTGWVFADFCATASGAHRSLSDSHSAGASAALVRLFEAGGGTHEVSVEIERRMLAGGAQTGLTLGWSSVWNRAVTEFSLGTATAIPGASATRLQLSARVGWVWRDRPVSLSVWHMQASGGMLLGMARDDQVTGIGLSVQARPGVSVEISHQVTRSTIALFNEARTGLSVRFQLGRH